MELALILTEVHVSTCTCSYSWYSTVNDLSILCMPFSNYRWMLYTWRRVSHRPVGGASPRMLLMGGVAFVWERERISNEDIVR